MRTWAKQASTVFFLGFAAFVVALGYGILADGLIFSRARLPFSLRGVGIGMMLGGMALWAMYERYRGGKPGINPLVGIMVAIGVILVLVAFFFPYRAILGPFMWAGWALNGLAMLIGLIAMIVNPAYETSPTTHWPEGGEPEPVEHHEPIDEHEPLAAMASEESAVSVAQDKEDAVTGVGQMGETAKAEAEVSVEESPPPAEEVEPLAPDDLTKIEGIGPKLNTILQDSGIETYADLAKKTPEEIRAVVDASSMNSPYDPTTWPEQAQLAASGDWDGLKDLQDDLKGGRR